MTADDWKKIKFFTSRENWGDVSLIVPELVERLDRFREFINHPVVITCGTQGKHTDGSEHYKGRAVDIIVPIKGITPVDLIFAAERFNFTGLGYYPDWSIGREVWGGLHLDVREIVGPDARWMGVKDYRNGNQSYKPLTYTNLKTYSQPF